MTPNPVTGRKSELMRTSNLVIGYRAGGIANILFDQLNLEIRAHELICFMGPNGIGKSTLIRTLAGLQKPLNGGVFASERNDAPKEISVVLTDRVTAVNMTVNELVTYGRYPHLDWNMRLSREDKAAVMEAIELTHISHLRNKRLYELSDGQMQMAMIARALAQNTPLVFLDEPTAHLDLNNRVEIMNLLRKLTRTTGKGILVATHELDLALQTADLIWLAGKNKNILSGIPEDLVLNGSFDEIFQLKGFDLKTGKIWHEPWRGISVGVAGDGHAYLWTKNALERCGFEVNDQSAESIQIINESGALQWRFRGRTLNSVSAMLKMVEGENA